MGHRGHHYHPPQSPPIATIQQYQSHAGQGNNHWQRLGKTVTIEESRESPPEVSMSSVSDATDHRPPNAEAVVTMHPGRSDSYVWTDTPVSFHPLWPYPTHRYRAYPPLAYPPLHRPLGLRKSRKLVLETG